MSSISYKSYSDSRSADKKRPLSLIRTLLSNPNIYFEEMTKEYYIYIKVSKKSQLMDARAYIKHQFLNEENFTKEHFDYIVIPDYRMFSDELEEYYI